MVEILAASKRELLSEGFPIEEPDDPYIAAVAVRVDFRIIETALTIEALREAEGIAVPIRTDLVRDLKRDLRAAEEEFREALEFLPAMSAFEASWRGAWQVMVTERAWPHATTHRRSWRRAMLETKPETRACFLGQPTGFQRMSESILAAVEENEADEDLLIGLMVA